jgi:hypothetical protein
MEKDETVVRRFSYFLSYYYQQDSTDGHHTSQPHELIRHFCSKAAFGKDTADQTEPGRVYSHIGSKVNVSCFTIATSLSERSEEKAKNVPCLED